jgi:dolichol kinase
MQRADLKERPYYRSSDNVIAVDFPSKRRNRGELSIEFTRKSIHLLIAFVPLILSYSRVLDIWLLSLGCLAFFAFESLRMRGINVPLISALTAKSARIRDADHFVKGPITLGLGALISILIFKPIPASIAIYILAFGDGLSSLVGKTIGRIRLPFTQGKSLEGSLTCFTVSFFSAYILSQRPTHSLIIALVSTFVEALPTKDWDNILLPVAAGLTATLLGL